MTLTVVKRDVTLDGRVHRGVRGGIFFTKILKQVKFEHGSRKCTVIPGFIGVYVTRSLVLYACFVDRFLSIYTFSLVIVLSVLL